MKKYPLLEQVYSAEIFEELGRDLMTKIGAYHRKQQSDTALTNHWQTPDEELSYWQNYNFHSFSQFVDDVLERSIHIHNPKYMGHQVSAPAPLAVLTELLSNALNNGSAVYEMGQVSNVLEKIVIDLFCQKVGYDTEAGGLLTSGGTLANLTALLAARQALKEIDVWKNGHSNKLAVLVSSQAHYSIDRAARVLGLGNTGVVLVKVNDDFSMNQQALIDAYRKTQKAGYQVIAIVGSACSTAAGVYDDLLSIGQFCQQNNLWFHVDAAHGGAAIFSEQYKFLLNGIELADSIIIDTHKMMLTPALTTVLLFKDKIKGSQTFHQKAQYLFADDQIDQQWYNSGLRTFECTKKMMSLKFFVLWKTYGLQVFAENVECLYGLGQTFAHLLKQHLNFELALMPQTNIVCFRYSHSDLNDQQLNELNKNIRQFILEDDEFYIVQTTLNDVIYLRVTLMNPLTNLQHLTALLSKIEQIAQEQISQLS